jgi:hypothetical protein
MDKIYVIYKDDFGYFLKAIQIGDGFKLIPLDEILDRSQTLAEIRTKIPAKKIVRMERFSVPDPAFVEAWF